LYTKNPSKDVYSFVKAFATNQLAKFTPELYVNLTHQTGRGEEDGDPLHVSDYFIRCFHEYREQLGHNKEEFTKYLSGKLVLEYGPGDILGVALLMYAHGAERIDCVDKFPLSKLSKKNINVYEHILNSLDSDKRERANSAFKEVSNPGSGFNPSVVSYNVTKNGLSGASGLYDLIISRAVLEHVNSLEETMYDIKRSLKINGISIHKVDLKSHGLDRYTDLDFLTWPTKIYKLMYSHKGFINRWRINKYIELADCYNLLVKKLSPTEMLDKDKLDIIYSKVAKEFTSLSPNDLSWLGFWIILEHS